MSATLTSHNLTLSTGPVALNPLPASSRQFKNGQVKAVILSVGSFLGLVQSRRTIRFAVLVISFSSCKHLNPDTFPSRTGLN
jgi:hypothetical protein